MQRKIKIQVDHREKASPIFGLLLQTPFEIELCRLRWGDYVINDLVSIERKGAADFLISIIDGRLFRQARGLKSCSRRPVFCWKAIHTARKTRSIPGRFKER